MSSDSNCDNGQREGESQHMSSDSNCDNGQREGESQHMSETWSACNLDFTCTFHFGLTGKLASSFLLFVCLSSTNTYQTIKQRNDTLVPVFFTLLIMHSDIILTFIKDILLNCRSSNKSWKTSQSQKGCSHECSHTPSIAFRHLPPVLGVWTTA